MHNECNYFGVTACGIIKEDELKEEAMFRYNSNIQRKRLCIHNYYGKI